MTVGQAMKEGAEAYSLNNPFYYKADSFSAAAGAVVCACVIVICFCFVAAAFHAFAFLIFPEIKSASSARPPPVRLLTRKRGAPGFTLS